MESNIRQNVVFAMPKSLEERQELAGSCVRQLHIKIPALLDSIQNATEVDYTGWPDRMYLIDLSGRVVYKSKPGPFGFHAAELGNEIKGILK